MSKRIVYGRIFSFIVLFVLGFVLTPWLSLASFVFLSAAVAYLIYERYIKK